MKNYIKTLTFLLSTSCLISLSSTASASDDGPVKPHSTLTGKPVVVAPPTEPVPAATHGGVLSKDVIIPLVSSAEITASETTLRRELTKHQGNIITLQAKLPDIERRIGLAGTDEALLAPLREEKAKIEREIRDEVYYTGQPTHELAVIDATRSGLSIASRGVVVVQNALGQGLVVASHSTTGAHQFTVGTRDTSFDSAQYTRLKEHRLKDEKTRTFNYKSIEAQGYYCDETLMEFYKNKYPERDTVTKTTEALESFLSPTGILQELARLSAEIRTGSKVGSTHPYDVAIEVIPDLINHIITLLNNPTISDPLKLDIHIVYPVLKQIMADCNRYIQTRRISFMVPDKNEYAGGEVLLGTVNISEIKEAINQLRKILGLINHDRNPFTTHLTYIGNFIEHAKKFSQQAKTLADSGDNTHLPEAAQMDDLAFPFIGYYTYLNYKVKWHSDPTHEVFIALNEGVNRLTWIIDSIEAYEARIAESEIVESAKLGRVVNAVNPLSLADGEATATPDALTDAPSTAGPVTTLALAPKYGSLRVPVPRAEEIPAEDLALLEAELQAKIKSLSTRGKGSHFISKLTDVVRETEKTKAYILTTRPLAEQSRGAFEVAQTAKSKGRVTVVEEPKEATAAASLSPLASLLPTTALDQAKGVLGIGTLPALGLDTVSFRHDLIQPVLSAAPTTYNDPQVRNLITGMQGIYRRLADEACDSNIGTLVRVLEAEETEGFYPFLGSFKLNFDSPTLGFLEEDPLDPFEHLMDEGRWEDLVAKVSDRKASLGTGHLRK